MESVYGHVLKGTAPANDRDLLVLVDPLNETYHFTEARTILDYLIGRYRQSGDRQGLQRALGDQARIFRETGDLEKAMPLLHEQERICRDSGHMDGLLKCLAEQTFIPPLPGRLRRRTGPGGRAGAHLFHVRQPFRSLALPGRARCHPSVEGRPGQSAGLFRRPGTVLPGNGEQSAAPVYAPVPGGDPAVAGRPRRRAGAFPGYGEACSLHRLEIRPAGEPGGTSLRPPAEGRSRQRPFAHRGMGADICGPRQQVRPAGL
jgi:hypothetical protein